MQPIETTSGPGLTAAQAETPNTQGGVGDPPIVRITDGDRGATLVAADVPRSGYVYPLMHSDPETDHIIRAICEALGIDWREMRRRTQAEEP